MKFAFIDAERANFPVDFMCAQLEVSRSGYYAWRGRSPSVRAVDDEKLGVAVAAAHAASRCTYGSPRVLEDLRGAGIRTSRKRVARLMRERELRARRPRRFRRTTDSNHQHLVAPNLLERAFAVDEPNRVWVTDITYVWTAEGWLYVAAILDLYSRAVVGWAMSPRIDTELCLNALTMALVARRPPPGLVHHSDRGSQYASREYRAVLEAHDVVCSMSRKGDCWDNAVAESFWRTMKAELVDVSRFSSRNQARAAIFEYIEVFYNRRRRHSYLRYRAPFEHELMYPGPRQAA